MSEFNIEVQGGTAVKLPTAGKYCEKDIVVTAIGGGGGLEEIEQMIDESGVLDSTEGTTTEKVAVLVDIAEFNANVSDFHFSPSSKVERIEVYLSNEYKSLSAAFRDCENLKYIKGINSSKATSIQRLLMNSGVEVVDEPFDLSSVSGVNNANGFQNAYYLREVRIVPNTMFWGSPISSQDLSAESIQSIFDGLATVTTAQTLTLHPNLKILQSQVDSANAKGWTVAGGTVVSEEEYYG